MWSYSTDTLDAHGDVVDQDWNLKRYEAQSDRALQPAAADSSAAPRMTFQSATPKTWRSAMVSSKQRSCSWT